MPKMKHWKCPKCGKPINDHEPRFTLTAFKETRVYHHVCYLQLLQPKETPK